MNITKKLEQQEAELEGLFNKTKNEKDPNITTVPEQEKVSQNVEDQENVGSTTTTEDTYNEFDVGIEEPKTTQTQKSNDADYWKHKFEVLQGKYNAEIKRLVSQNDLLNSTILSLNSKISDLENKIANVNISKEPEQEHKISNTSIEAFKEEYPDMFEVISAMFSEKEKKYLEEINRLKSVIENTSKQVEMTSREKFYSELSKLVPNWESINVDKRFLSWLKEEDEFSGIIRHDLLLNAFNNFDVNKVAKIFRAFESSIGGNSNYSVNTQPQQREKPRQFISNPQLPSDSQVNSLSEEIKKSIISGNLKRANELEKKLEELFTNRR